MKTSDLIERLQKALHEFLEKESDLLKQDAHEEAISTSFTHYLRNEFSDFPYNIDSQYDKRVIDGDLYKKKVDMLIGSLPKNKIPTKCYEGQKFVTKEILPDIIFHDRHSSEHNFLVIEVKKSTNKNKNDREFDLLKLTEMTSGDLDYEFGAFLDFNTGSDFNAETPYSLMIIKEGKWLKA